MPERTRRKTRSSSQKVPPLHRVGGQNNTIPPVDSDADPPAAAAKTRSLSPKVLQASVPNNRIPTAEVPKVAKRKTRSLSQKVQPLHQVGGQNNTSPPADADAAISVAAAKTRSLSLKLGHWSLVAFLGPFGLLFTIVVVIGGGRSLVVGH
eukprot:jgi/Psemu1/894/gm1.894_g